jgi:hypothetical protein
MQKLPVHFSTCKSVMTLGGGWGEGDLPFRV